MARQRPLSLLLVGLACSFFAALYLLWLLLATWAPLAQLLAVAFGDADPLPDLVRVNLATTKTVRAAVLLGSVRARLDDGAPGHRRGPGAAPPLGTPGRDLRRRPGPSCWRWPAPLAGSGS